MEAALSLGGPPRPGGNRSPGKAMCAGTGGSRCTARARYVQRCGLHRVRYPVDVSYQPMTLAALARFVAGEPDFDSQWRLVVEFLEEYH